MEASSPFHCSPSLSLAPLLGSKCCSLAFKRLAWWSLVGHRLWEWEQLPWVEARRFCSPVDGLRSNGIAMCAQRGQADEKSDFRSEHRNWFVGAWVLVEEVPSASRQSLSSTFKFDPESTGSPRLFSQCLVHAHHASASVWPQECLEPHVTVCTMCVSTPSGVSAQED